MSNIWDTFVAKVAGKNYQKSPNMVTLLTVVIVSHTFSRSYDGHFKMFVFHSLNETTLKSIIYQLKKIMQNTPVSKNCPLSIVNVPIYVCTNVHMYVPILCMLKCPYVCTYLCLHKCTCV